MLWRLAVALVFLLPVDLVSASKSSPKTRASRKVRRSYRQSHACPSTGKKSGACPGYTIDRSSGEPIWKPKRQ